MGQFTNSTYTQTIESLVKATESKINNPYYKFSDKKPTEVVYYKQNKEKSTLDPASGTNYQHVGDYSPIKFNKINGFVLYGLGRIELNYEVGEYGLEASEISGDAVILPNTIIPSQGDYFSVPYIKEDVLFKVNLITPDTLDNGANFYKIEYKLELVNQTAKIEEQVVATYNFVASNVGTDFNCFITEENTELISQLSSILEEQTSLYQLFFDNSVQTFVYTYNGCKMYDPYMIEFLIRTKIMSYSKEYFFIAHATVMDKMFPYHYTKTFFNTLENPEEFDLNTIKNLAVGIKIEDINSLFYTRIEDYYKIEYFPKFVNITRFGIFDNDVLSRIESGEYYIEGDDKYIYNIWIAYFNNDTSYLNDNMISIIKNFDYQDNRECFYLVPINMYIISKYIESLMK